VILRSKASKIILKFRPYTAGPELFYNSEGLPMSWPELKDYLVARCLWSKASKIMPRIWPDRGSWAIFQ